MATLILTAVGTAVGGPIGGAIGALIGRQADAAIFAPKAPQGPRLGDLAVQTSSYGTALPKIFGTMRVAGTVIWATDLEERKNTNGGGKGQPKTTSYSYSASFAVVLSARPIRSVRRIWADGKLLRGAAGDFKSATKYRLYLGGEEQSADAFIASAEGIGRAPAFRDLAYAMFEDFELADYGNRIPSLTFEVMAEEAAVEIGTIAEELSDGIIVGEATPVLLGYAAGGESVRAAIETLADLTPLSLLDPGGSLRLTAASAEPTEIAEEEMGATAGAAGGRSEVTRTPESLVAGEVSIAYYDPARDYQTGLQRASRTRRDNAVERRALAAVLQAPGAKAMAEHRLAWLHAARTTAKVHLGPARIGLRPGACVRMEGHPRAWTVARWTLGTAGLVSLELSGAAAAKAQIDQADPGRPVPSPDVRHGPTTLRLFDIPLYENSSDRPRLFAAAAGIEAGWRRAALAISYDLGANWTEIGDTATAAVMGEALTALGPAGSTLFDDRNSFEVELLSDAMWIESRGEAALIGGANLALLGDELLQFGKAEALGDRRFRLSHLLRSRRGTEWATTHSEGEAFTMIEAVSLSAVEAPAGAIGGEVRLMASGLEDDEGTVESVAVSGESARPPSPVHLTAERFGNGDIAIQWIRRSRSGWDWLSGADVPLGEERELYRIKLSGDGFVRTAEIAGPSYLYSFADQTADGVGATLAVEVSQLGTVAASRPNKKIFTLEAI